MAKLSIIVPVYNVEKYLKECIDSILNQKFQDFELILVNDGSTDLSGKICDEYSKKDNRIEVIHKANGGLSSARNEGIEKAKGVYIGFVDSDDWINENMYSHMIDNSNIHNADIVVCNIMSMKKNGDEIPYTNINNEISFTREEAMSELFKNEIILFSACNKIFRKIIFDGLRYKEGIILEDMDLSYKIFNRVNKVYYIHNPYYHYRYNDNSILRSEFNLKRLDEYMVRKEMYEFYRGEYPDIADLVYYYVCITGSFLYASICNNSSLDKTKYSYLIAYDKIILKRILSRSGISKKIRFNIRLFLNVPKIENIIRRIFMKTKTSLKILLNKNL